MNCEFNQTLHFNFTYIGDPSQECHRFWGSSASKRFQTLLLPTELMILSVWSSNYQSFCYQLRSLTTSPLHPPTYNEVKVSRGKLVLGLNVEGRFRISLADLKWPVPCLLAAGCRVTRSSRYNECMLTEVRVRYHAPSPPDTSERHCRVLRLPANASDKTRPLFTPLASKNVPWPERDQATQFPVCQCVCSCQNRCRSPKWLRVKQEITERHHLRRW